MSASQKLVASAITAIGKWRARFRAAMQTPKGPSASERVKALKWPKAFLPTR